MIKIIEDFIYYNDGRFTENENDSVYALSGITMSISGASGPNYASSFISELETYKIPFFQSAPNVKMESLIGQPCSKRDQRWGLECGC